MTRLPTLALALLAAAAVTLAAAAAARPPARPAPSAPPTFDAGWTPDATAALADAVAARLAPPPPSRAARVLTDVLSLLLAAAVAALATAAAKHRGGGGRATDAAARARLLDALRAGDDVALRRALGTVALPTWARFPDFERADFVNAAVANAWPYASAAAAAAVAERVNPLLAHAKPTWLTAVAIDRFDLGPRPPTVEGIKTYARSKDAIIFEADLDWRAATLDVELVVNPLPSRLPLPLVGRAPLIAGATRALARAVKVRAGVERIALAARVRVELAPLLRELPIAGALSVSLVAPPDVRFALTVYGGDVGLIPGLEAWLASLLRDAARPYVLPGRFTLPLTQGPLPGVALPTGMAFVTVVEATDLPWMDPFSPSDAYVRLSIGGGRAHRTRVIPNSSHPVWLQDVALLVHAPATTLEIVVYDADRIDRDDEIGRAVVDVAAATAPAAAAAAPLTADAGSAGVVAGGPSAATTDVDRGAGAHTRTHTHTTTQPSPPAPRTADLWLPLTRTAAAASSLADEWRRPAHGVGHIVKAARLGAASARSGCGLNALWRRLAGARSDLPLSADGDPVPRLHLRIAYHPFSGAERAAAAQAAAGRVHPAARADPRDSAAVDLLKGGLLIVRPRSAAGLPYSKLGAAFGVRPHWVVRASVAGVAAETGAVSKGPPAAPLFNEPLELLVGARALAAAAVDGDVLLQVIDGRGSQHGRRRRGALVGTAAVRLDQLLATGRAAGEWSLVPPGEGGAGRTAGGGPPLPTAGGDAVRTPLISAEVAWVALVSQQPAGV